MVESNPMPLSIHASQMPKPPLGALGALRAGFAAVNNRFELALFPLVLDLFLWLGPRLSIKPITIQLDQLLVAGAPAYGNNPQMAQQLEQMRAMLTLLGNQYNLFSVLSTVPLGVPSLMAARMPESVPAGWNPAVWPVYNLLLHLALVVLFNLAGFFLGAVYFNCIAQQVRTQRVDAGLVLRQVWGDWVRLVVLAVLVALALGVVLAPVWFVGSLLAMLAPMLGTLVVVVTLTVVMWGVFYLGFTVPAISLERRGLLGGLWDSARVAQASLPATAGLYSLLFLSNLLLTAIWNLVTPDSWVTLAALGGNALVATALVSAFFAYYQDRYRWWNEMRQALRASQAAAEPKPL